MHLKGAHSFILFTLQLQAARLVSWLEPADIPAFSKAVYINATCVSLLPLCHPAYSFCSVVSPSRNASSDKLLRRLFLVVVREPLAAVRFVTEPAFVGGIIRQGVECRCEGLFFKQSHARKMTRMLSPLTAVAARVCLPTSCITTPSSPAPQRPLLRWCLPLAFHPPLMSWHLQPASCLPLRQSLLYPLHAYPSTWTGCRIRKAQEGEKWAMLNVAVADRQLLQNVVGAS